MHGAGDEASTQLSPEKPMSLTRHVEISAALALSLLRIGKPIRHCQAELSSVVKEAFGGMALLACSLHLNNQTQAHEKTLRKSLE